MQKERERQLSSHTLCAETITAMWGSLEACRSQTLDNIAQMSLTVSDMLSCWVLPADLIAEECVNDGNAAAVWHVKLLCLPHRVLCTCEVHKAWTCIS